ncbi:RNA 2',3'-cyclic phosphodiesterase [Legionella maioricensis]|uniref:RNA 2',3'-cyclic phosphodiesterase n=1 Tax=Legionella maioricensis TaxID=2896528 RepID=A0A9X2IDN2_9GAMM|nr:RNA 2',3'-cyclic phosphodiesterase [Legionella maioricensis]MCL9684953.1 RNA 2',3'-cyclic phosphodiesterase [Legionella maioricensis]MCL9688215.1 RNA 2',3'-cyclic phosphodiesterase [Legionella maioricensis]
MMNTIRAFFAIMPPQSMHDPLENILKTLKHATPEHSIKWINIKNLHITLQFLKKVQTEDVNPLIEQVRAELKNTKSFQLELNHLEWFPGPRHPKILSLAVGPQDILAALSATIARAITALNYPVELRPFRGHISIGRVPHRRPQPTLLTTIKLPALPPVFINELYLIESKPDNGRTSYLPLAQFSLSDS